LICPITQGSYTYRILSSENVTVARQSFLVFHMMLRQSFSCCESYTSCIPTIFPCRNSFGAFVQILVSRHPLVSFHNHNWDKFFLLQLLLLQVVVGHVADTASVCVGDTLYALSAFVSCHKKTDGDSQINNPTHPFFVDDHDTSIPFFPP